MQQNTKDAILQLVQNTQNGLLGEEAKAEHLKLQNSTTNAEYYLSFILNQYKLVNDDNKEFANIGRGVCESVLLAYRNAKKINTITAKGLAESLVVDFPNTQRTNLLLRYQNLLHASIAFKSVIPLNNYITMLSASATLNASYQEFLSGLLGYINIAVKAALDKKYSNESLSASYQSKLEEFQSLNLHYIMPIFSNLADVEIRNAIAHGKYWHNKEEDTIVYEANKKSPTDTKSIPLLEFVGKAAAGTHLCVGYITAVSVIQFMNTCTFEDFLLLPKAIQEIFHSDAFPFPQRG